MKKILLILMFVVSISIAYILGDQRRQKCHDRDYQVACILSDIVRNTMDNIPEAQEIYYDYIDNLDCDSNLIINKEDLKNYYYCY